MFEKGIAVVGSTTIDTNEYGAKRFHKIGGVTTYSGITYRRHGIATHIISNVAQKDIRILENLRHEQLTIHNGFSDQTTHFVNQFENDSRSQKIPVHAAPINTDQLTGVREIAGAVHLGPLHPADIDSRCTEIFSESGLPVFVDIQGYTRYLRDGHVHTRVSNRLSSVLKISKLAKANESELVSILRYYRMNLAELLSTFGVDEFVVTRGRHGGYVHHIGGGEYPYDAAKTHMMLDPTGAGDVFFAAYTVGRFLNKLNIADACSYAAKLAARQVSGDYIAQEKLHLTQDSK
jgi:sugar/nucleoside kinase (ribokinase family)